MADNIITNEELREKLKEKGVDISDTQKYPDGGNCLKFINDFLDCVQEVQDKQNSESSKGASVSILNTTRRRVDNIKLEFPPGSGNYYNYNSVSRMIGYKEKIEVTEFLPNIRD